MSGDRRPARLGSCWGATALGMVGMLLWATETVLASFTHGLPPFEITGLAFACAALLAPLAWRISGDDPRIAFRQPWRVWVITVPSLVGYHACIYFALHRVPAAPAALLQGCTPLFLVFGTALVGGRRLRWWHLAGTIAGLEGLVALSIDGHGLAAVTTGASPLLLLIGLAAGLWGLYSLVTSRFAAVPTSAMGVFYAASALAAIGCHVSVERWVSPSATQWAAVAGLGLLPMGLALFCWDFGLKRGDVQALGAASYMEPLIGAGLVVALGQGDLNWSMLVSGLVIIGGAVLGAANAFMGEAGGVPASRDAPRSDTTAVRIPAPLYARASAAAAAAGSGIEPWIERAIESTLHPGTAQRAAAHDPGAGSSMRAA